VLDERILRRTSVHVPSLNLNRPNSDLYRHSGFALFVMLRRPDVAPHLPPHPTRVTPATSLLRGFRQQ
jgi:hypothetical protein